MEKLEIIRGDRVPLNFTFTDETDSDNIVPFSLVGYTIFFTIKYSWDKTSDDDNALVKKSQAVHTDAVNGLSEIILTTSDTDLKIDDYKADIQIVDGSGNPVSSETFKVCVVDDVTKRIS